MRMTCNRRVLTGAIASLIAVMSNAGEAPPSTIPLSATQAQAGGVGFSAVQAVDAATDAGLSLRLQGRVVVPNPALDAVLAPAEGRIEAVLVDPGQAVRGGQALVRLRSAQVLEQQRELVTARARAALAGSRAQRDEQLLAEGIISRNRLLESQSAATEAEAALQAQVQVLRLSGFSAGAVERIRVAADILPAVTLSAPRAGRVLQLSVAAGQAVAQGDPLLRIASLEKLWLEMQATRDQVRGIHPGDAVTVAGCPAAGRVVASALLVESQSQTVTVRAEMPRAGECLAPNQFVEARLAPRAATGLVAVPDASVVQHGGASYVFLRTREGLQPVAVTVERRANGQAWLRAALQPGAMVASSGLAAIKGSWLGLGTATQAP